MNEHAENLREAAIYLDSDGAEHLGVACRDAAAEIDRLTARVMELETKVIADKVLDDISRRCLPPDAYTAVVHRRDWLLVNYDPESDFVVEVIQPSDYSR